MVNIRSNLQIIIILSEKQPIMEMKMAMEVREGIMMIEILEMDQDWIQVLQGQVSSIYMKGSQMSGPIYDGSYDLIRMLPPVRCVIAMVWDHDVSGIFRCSDSSEKISD